MYKLFYNTHKKKKLVAKFDPPQTDELDKILRYNLIKFIMQKAALFQCSDKYYTMKLTINKRQVKPVYNNTGLT